LSHLNAWVIEKELYSRCGHLRRVGVAPRDQMQLTIFGKPIAVEEFALVERGGPSFWRQCSEGVVCETKTLVTQGGGRQDGPLQEMGWLRCLT
jgi:hypothetical protein